MTFGSEFITACIATEQILDLCFTLMAMGVPIEVKSWLLGDNQSVLKSSTLPTSSLAERHNALAYHKVRSVISAGILNFCFTKSKQNASDVLTKFLPFSVFWPLIQPILFWYGDTTPSCNKPRA